MKTVARYSMLSEAHIALTRLHSAGVDAVIRDEFTITCDWFMSNAIGGVKIEVVEEDVAAAAEILRMPAPDEGVLKCPHCGGNDLAVRTLSVLGAALIILKVPIPLAYATVDCRRCGRAHYVRLDGARK